MICIKCGREIDKSYAAPGFIGNYCEPCAIAAEITTHQMAQKRFIELGEMAAETARSMARLNKTIEGFEDGLKAGLLQKARIDAISEFAKRIKEKAFSVPTVYNSHFSRMADAVEKEMLEGEKQ